MCPPPHSRILATPLTFDADEHLLNCLPFALLTIWKSQLLLFSICCIKFKILNGCCLSNVALQFAALVKTNHFFRKLAFRIISYLEHFAFLINVDDEDIMNYLSSDFFQRDIN